MGRASCPPLHAKGLTRGQMHGDQNRTSTRAGLYLPGISGIASPAKPKTDPKGGAEEPVAKPLILCDCAGSQQIDDARIAEWSGRPCSKVHSNLCTSQIELAAKLMQDGPVTIACGQEQATFLELAEEIGAAEPDFVDLRDRAGWSDEGADAAPKMAALAAEAALAMPQTRTMDVVSEGLCLIIGAPEVALEAAEQLQEMLSVTVLLPPGSEVPASRDIDVTLGRIKRASGALGGFEIVIDDFQMIAPEGRGAFQLSKPRNGARTQCDIVLDLSGDMALFPAPEKREGYLRADPRHAPSVATAVMTASHLTGTFEKPLYLDMQPEICAHSRASKTGCTRCLDVCPTGAIAPDGDHVTIDPMVCAGCGSCAAVCPSGAIRYDQPPVASLFQRMQTLADVSRKAHLNAPYLLVHDAEFGVEMIRLSARFGRGLPARVIPFAVTALAGFGHAEALAALATGFARVIVLAAPTTERDALDREITLAQTLQGPGTVQLIDPSDPDALEQILYDLDAPDTPMPAPILPLGERRQVTRLAATALNGPQQIDLPEGAPYGAVVVDTDACTLCLACASLCPSGALGDNPEMPQLRFQEDACLQCGLCANVCPESAITLTPRLDLTEDALRQTILHEEEPYACIECGKLFGVKSTVERIVAQLSGKHPMFATSDAGRMIRMCDDCRVNAQYHAEKQPFAQGERPKVRTTDDYLSKRRDH